MNRPLSEQSRPNNAVAAALALLTIAFATGVAIWWWPLDLVEAIFVIVALVIPASAIYRVYIRDHSQLHS